MSKKLRTGKRTRRIPINDAAAKALASQRQAFKRKFGREPGPDDPAFFDPSASTPQPIPADEADRQLVIAMEKAGIDPAMIYACRKSGVIVTEFNYHLIPRDRLNAYEAALEEYHRMH